MEKPLPILIPKKEYEAKPYTVRRCTKCQGSHTVPVLPMVASADGESTHYYQCPVTRLTGYVRLDHIERFSNAH
jgi:hypothetical protein